MQNMLNMHTIQNMQNMTNIQQYAKYSPLIVLPSPRRKKQVGEAIECQT